LRKLSELVINFSLAKSEQKLEGSVLGKSETPPVKSNSPQTKY